MSRRGKRIREMEMTGQRRDEKGKTREVSATREPR